MLKVYRMPNGRRYLFDDKDAPKGAVPIEKKPAPAPPKPEKTVEKKAEPAKKNKAVKTTANKSKKAATK